MLNDNLLTKKLYWIWATLLLSGLLTACSSTSAATEAAPASVEQPNYAGKKVVWVDSYHEGYAGGVVENGLRSILNDTSVDLKVIRLDTKRNTDEAYGKEAGANAKAEIDAFKPDVVIATEDNAQKYVIVPYYKDTDMPIVFAGVNWSASAYGFPTDNVTGMIEIELIEQMMELLQPHAQGDRVGYLGPDVFTDQKTADTYNDRFFDGNLQIRLVNSVDDFKQTFVDMQDEVDILIIGNASVLEDWDEGVSGSFTQFMLENTRIPSGARLGLNIPYALLSIAKDNAEQGEWAAEAALQVLDGTSVSDIPVTENKRGNLVVNLNMAEQLGIVFSPSILKNAEIYSLEE